MSARRAFVARAALLPLAGCGFQLRGSASLPYESLYVDMPESSPLGAELKRNLRTGTSTRIAVRREEADAILVPVREARAKTILSLSSSGRVREFRLKYNFDVRVIDRQGRDLIAPLSMLIERDFPFNDAQVLAKETEEALIYRDMQSDMVQQVLRRLEAAPLLKRDGPG
jgi:LPS-assembly lipoprotein